MRKRDLVVALLAGCAVLSVADWLDDGGNPRRNGWRKDCSTSYSFGIPMEH